MPTPGDVVAQRTLIYLLAGGGVATYVASKAAVDAIVGKSLPTSGRLALGHGVTLAAVTLVAMAMGEPKVAVALIFASSVVCLTLGVGSLAVIGDTVHSGARRPVSAMLLPITLAAFLAGFQGRLTLTHAVALLLLGLMTVLLWRGFDGDDGPKLAMARRGHIGVRAFQLLLAVALAVVGGWAAVRGISGVHPSNGIATPGLLTVTLLAPLLVLPALGVGIDLAQRHRSAVACDGLAGIVLLNLCVLLPACIVEANFHVLQRTLTAALPPPVDPLAIAPPATQPITRPSSRPTPPSTSPAVSRPAQAPPQPPGGKISQPHPPASSQPARQATLQSGSQGITPPTLLPLTTQPATQAAPAVEAPGPALVGLVFPRTSWRIDAVALVVLAVLLLPVGLGRWPLTRGDGIGLVLAYLAYVLMAVVMQLRS